MSEPFIGEIRIFGFTYPPRGWAFCDGAIVSIQQYTALYSIIGTTYGGNGSTSFQLPNFMGRAPMHWGAGPGLTPRDIGETLGDASVTLDGSQIPAHTHMLIGAATSASAPSQLSAAPGGTAYFTNAAPALAYNNTASPNTPLSPRAIAPQGGSQPHENLQPLQVLNFCIALEGIFPTRN